VERDRRDPRPDDFDLNRHQEQLGKKLEYFDQAENSRYVPYIVETSAGADG